MADTNVEVGSTIVVDLPFVFDSDPTELISFSLLTSTLGDPTPV